MKPIPIGSRVIDALPATQATLAGPTLHELKALLADPKSTAEQFLSLMAPEQILAIVIASPDDDRKREIPSELRGDVERLAEIVSRELPVIKSHNGFALAARSAAETLAQAPQEGNFSSWKTVIGLGGIPVLVGENEPLTPAIRVVLKMSSPGADFDFTADADDLAFLAKGFGEFLAEMLEKRAGLASNGLVEILRRSEIVERISELERAIQKIKLLAPQFGIVFDPPQKL